MGKGGRRRGRGIWLQFGVTISEPTARLCPQSHGHCGLLSQRPEEQSRAQRAGQKQHSAIAYRDRAPHRAPQAGKDQHFRMVSTATGWVLLPSVNVRMHACLHACMHVCLSVCLCLSVSRSVMAGWVYLASLPHWCEPQLGSWSYVPWCHVPWCHVPCETTRAIESPLTSRWDQPRVTAGGDGCEG